MNITTAKRHAKIDWGISISIIVLLCFSVLFSIDILNYSKHQAVGFDEAYNASVAANVVRAGKYAVSYPDNIVFYNAISVGETIILPTALIFKCFGISTQTVALTALFYGVGSIWLMWGILRIITHKDSRNTQISSIFISIVVILFCLADGWFYFLSSRLIGEIAAFFYLLLAFYFMSRFFQHPEKKMHFFFSGIFLIIGFLSKSSMIFFEVSTIGLLLFETIIRRIDIKAVVYFLGGIVTGFVILETYKLLQLGSVSSWVTWWSNEWKNMINQSSGIDTSISMNTKINFLHDVFLQDSTIICLLITFMPIICFLFFSNNWLFGKRIKDQYVKGGLLSASIMGVGGASLIVFFILFGGSGLFYARRHSVNEMVLRFFCCYLIILQFDGMSYYLKAEKRITKAIVRFLSVVVSIMLVTPPQSIAYGMNEIIEKEESDSYALQLMNSFIEEVSELPEDASLYVCGWWQEPNVSLFTDRKIQNIQDLMNKGERPRSPAYFLVGSCIHDIPKSYIEDWYGIKLVRKSKTNINYTIYDSGFNRMDFDNYSIYEIIQGE